MTKKKYLPFKNDYLKNSGSQNQFIKPKNMILEKGMEEDKRNKMIMWNTFFRRNPHRFVETYLGIRLFPYQIIWIYLMSISNVFVAICSRGSAKSFLVAVFAVSQAILYPGSEIAIGSSTRSQAGLIISSKVTYLRNTSPMLQREIISLTVNMNQYEAIFANGSKIKVVAANEGARGERSSLLILDEFKLLKKDVVDKIFTPFLYVRQAPFKQKSEYNDYPEEEPRKISISSAGLKAEWWYKETITTIKMMLEGKSAGFFCTDYLISIFHKIKTASQMEKEEETSDPISFDMEYRNLPSGSSNKTYFKPQMFARNIKNAFYPHREDLLNKKQNPYGIKKLDGEIRILSLDIASRANKINDNSILACVRLLPTQKGYQRKVVYIESSHGSNIATQALRIKEVYYDFDADYIVMDIAQNGISVFDVMSSITHSDQRGIDYPSFTVMESPLIEEAVRRELQERTLGIDALPIIYPISATQRLNSEIAVSFRTALKKRLFDFLATDTDAEDYLTKTNKEFFESADDFSIRAFLLHPFVQTNLLVAECINLEMSVVNNNIKLTEGTGRKDRYTALSYANWFISNVLDRNLLRQEGSDDDWESIKSVTFVF